MRQTEAVKLAKVEAYLSKIYNHGYGIDSLNSAFFAKDAATIVRGMIMPCPYCQRPVARDARKCRCGVSLKRASVEFRDTKE